MKPATKVFLRSLTITKLFFPILILVLLFVFLSGPIKIESLEKILPITTFLFGLMVTFLLSDRYKRYESVNSLEAKQSGDLTSLFFMSKLIDKKCSQQMKIAVDNYVVNLEDYYVEDSIEYTSEPFYNIFEVIKKNYSKVKSSEAGEMMLGLFDELSNLRKELDVDLKNKLTLENWFIISALAAILLFSLQALKTGSFIFDFIVFLFSFVTMLILFLLRDLDNLMWGGHFRSSSSEMYQRVLERIGSTRYYPITVLNKLSRPPRGKDYRVGIYLKPYPDNTKKIKIVRASKSKSL